MEKEITEFILTRIQKLFGSKRYSRGIRINYILCTIFFIILNFSSLHQIFRGEMIISSDSIVQFQQQYLDQIPDTINQIFIAWIIITLILSVKSFHTETDTDIITGVKNPKCPFCSSHMSSTLKCSNSSCNGVAQRS